RSGYLSNSGTRSHFQSDRLGDWKRKVSSLPVAICDRSQKTTGPFMKRSTSHACAVGIWL
ncbi:unnamed protein product, partial [Staurois parvus]